MKRMLIIVAVVLVFCAGCATTIVRTAGGMMAKEVAKKMIQKHKATSRPAGE